ncbi:MAG: hypothetical protein NT047_07490 [Deltaproteobacteria bacterium]|nr:hypothetical protein [Deltaproteobacteria bacterium]
MPIAELFGREYTIPFDPEVIAGLSYRGIFVGPDPGTKPDQINAEVLQIKTHLDKLWADQKMRTVPSGMETKPRIENPPVQEEAPPGNGFPMPQFQGAAKKFTAMKTMPTPKTTFNLRDITPDQLKRKPIVTEM